jgi:signal transduction histidine kinase
MATMNVPHPITRRSANKFLFPALSILLLLSLIATALATGSIFELMREQNTRQQATLVETQLDGVYEGLLNAETGQRGYIITGDSSYLAPYTAGKKQVPLLLESLKRELVDPQLKIDLGILSRLSGNKLSELRLTVGLRQTQGFDAAAAVVDTGKGKNLMDQSRALLTKMNNRQEAIIRAGNSQVHYVAIVALSVGVTSVLVTMGLGYFVLLLFQQSRKQSDELKVSNIELERSNKELQDFAYVASHDLQEPLRKIQAFSNLLEDEYATELGEGKDYLERMRNAAGRMSSLINDLLSFSRVTTQAKPFGEVHLKAIVNGVIGDLEVRIVETNAKVIVGALPTLHADSLQMRQLFQNLIGNALKFHDEEKTPLIRITSTTKKDASGKIMSYVISIRDNGIGFEEKYADRIFTLFQRLHTRDAYQGTGIGLAICRKIVERHGGSITAKSKIGKGSTFIISLPSKQV